MTLRFIFQEGRLATRLEAVSLCQEKQQVCESPCWTHILFAGTDWQISKMCTRGLCVEFSWERINRCLMCVRADVSTVMARPVRLNTVKHVVCVEASAYPEFLFFLGGGAADHEAIYIICI